MDIKLGQPVVSSDNQHVGKVDRLILDPQSRDIESIVVHKGIFLSEDRVLNVGLLHGVDAHGAVQAEISASKFAELPVFVETAYRIPTDDEYQSLPYPVDTMVVNTGMISPLLWQNPAGRTMGAGTTINEDAIAESGIPENMVAIDKGTAVFDRDGNAVGHVDDVLFDERGQMTSIVVKAGRIRRHEYRVPIQQVDRLLESEVRLTIKETDLVAQP